MSERSPVVRRQLQLRVSAIAVICLGVAAVGYVTFREWWRLVDGQRWLVVTAAVFAYEWFVLARNLGWNRRAETAPLRGSLGLANGVTLVRGMVLAVLAGLIVVPPPDGAAAWLAVGLYGTASLLDQVDGRLARRRNETTVLGARLDAEFDGIGLLVGGCVGVVSGSLPVWYLLVGLARFVFRGGIWAQHRTGRAVAALPESRLRRPLAGLQMAVVTLALVPGVDSTAVTVLATLAMLPFLARFAADWRAVTTRR